MVVYSLNTLNFWRRIVLSDAMNPHSEKRGFSKAVEVVSWKFGFLSFFLSFFLEPQICTLEEVSKPGIYKNPEIGWNWATKKRSFSETVKQANQEAEDQSTWKLLLRPLKMVKPEKEMRM